MVEDAVGVGTFYWGRGNELEVLFETPIIMIIKVKWQWMWL